MAIKRMNHAVLYVRDADRTTEFYRDVLGFRVVREFPGTAKFLQAPDSTNDHDLALFTIGKRRATRRPAGRPSGSITSRGRSRRSRTSRRSR